MLLEILEKYASKDGTIKILYGLNDGLTVESVFMMHDYGVSACVSSQAGCNMGCVFCASGTIGKIRDLSAEEMLGQVITADIPVTRITVMGTGEPFDNYDEVMRFADMVSDERKCLIQGEAIAPRHITISTCGMIPGIVRFGESKKKYNLAISLHASNNRIRDELMPVNKKYPIEKVLPAARDYCMITGRRIAFEYILLEGINDSDECAKELSLLLKPLEKAYVNLIPYNSTSQSLTGKKLNGVDKEKALHFYDILMKEGIKATLRKERGADIAAACGQLIAQRDHK